MKKTFICPNCGNPLEQRLNPKNNTCKYCFGQFDFNEIIQEKEPRKGKKRK